MQHHHDSYSRATPSWGTSPDMPPVAISGGAAFTASCGAISTSADFSRAEAMQMLGPCFEVLHGRRGAEFFSLLAAWVTEWLDADFVFVIEFPFDASHASCVVAGHCQDGPLPSMGLDLGPVVEGMALSKELRIFESGVDGRFPRHELLARWEIEGCAGLPLLGADRQHLGALVVLFQKPLTHRALAEPLMRALAPWAASEMDRWRMERRWLRHREDHRNLLRQMLRKQEEDRRALARDYHDELGQVFTAMKFSLAALEHSDPGTLPAKLQALQAQLNQTIERYQEWASNLCPSLLRDEGLRAAAKWQVDYARVRLGLNISFSDGGLGCARFGEDVEIAVFRILQESLTNAARHAGAQAVTVKLWLDGETLQLVVADDGQGYDGKSVLRGQETSLHGLGGMRSRAEMLGGRLAISSAPGLGTTVVLNVPLRGRKHS